MTFQQPKFLSLSLSLSFRGLLFVSLSLSLESSA